jgi:hypothetical protein
MVRVAFLGAMRTLVHPPQSKGPRPSRARLPRDAWQLGLADDRSLKAQVRAPHFDIDDGDRKSDLRPGSVEERPRAASHAR